MTTEPRRAPRSPAPGAERPGDHRATVLAALLLAASAAAVTWLLLGGRGHPLQAVPTPAGVHLTSDRTTTPVRAAGGCGPGTRGCADGWRPALPPRCCCGPCHPAVRR
ncbi:hypothetical protein ACH4FX_15645 [Streptomyces sp. NPDC018019]|uniref:hypothetical protein n=1 Tax=Streptomyces sp. NPDC018019 TaxID=3365030 RepID=UPI0037BBE88F